jgi:hypothetical protein
MKFPLLIFVCIAACMTGCTTGPDGKRHFAAPAFFTRTTNVTETASVIRAAQTNVVTAGTNVVVTITPAVIQTNYTTNILVTVAPAVGRTIEIAEGVNALNPTPTAPFVNIGLSVLSGLLGLVAAWKTKAANREARSNADTNAVLEAVVAGVEVIKDETARKIAKESVTRISEEWKMRDKVREKLDTLTP